VGSSTNDRAVALVSGSAAAGSGRCGCTWKPPSARRPALNGRRKP
jgi:hypothetical protein